MRKSMKDWHFCAMRVVRFPLYNALKKGKYYRYHRSKGEETKKMAQITTKELGALSDLLTMEENLTAKYRQTAADTADGTLKSCYEQMANKHQQHYDALVANLK